MKESIQLASIDWTPAYGVRGRSDAETVEQYKDAYLALESMPPIRLFRGGGKLFAGDGGHRGRGSAAAGLKEIDAEVSDFTTAEEAECAAVKYAAGANSEHGLRRSNEDKRAAISMLLSRPEWSDASDRGVADACKVHHVLVRQVRESMTANGDLSGPAAEKVKTYKTNAHLRGGNKTTDGKGNMVDRKPEPPAVKADDVMFEDAPDEPVASTIEPPKPKLLLDAKGREVPACIVDVFAARSWFRDMARLQTEWLEKIKEQAGQQKMLGTFLNGIEARVSDVKSEILSGMPHVVCPGICEGTGKTRKGSCPACRGRGWITKGGFSLLTREQLEVIENHKDDRRRADPSYHPETESEAA